MVAGRGEARTDLFTGLAVAAVSLTLPRTRQQEEQLDRTGFVMMDKLGGLMNWGILLARRVNVPQNDRFVD